MLCTSKSEAAVTGNKNRAVGMLKLTTDKHEASRGLSATAELLVLLHQIVYRQWRGLTTQFPQLQ